MSIQKLIKTLLFAVLVSSILTSNGVLARGHGGGRFGGGHHHHGGWGVGPGLYGFGLGYGLGYGTGYYGGYYPWGPYGGYYGYPPPIITVPAQPPVYIQQQRPATQHYQAGYWYYCSNPDGYYPYVKECLVRWQQVEPRPSVPR